MNEKCIICLETIDIDKTTEQKDKSLTCFTCSSSVCATCVPGLMQHGKLHDISGQIQCPCPECSFSFEEKDLLEFDVPNEIWEKYRSRRQEHAFVHESRHEYMIHCKVCAGILKRDGDTLVPTQEKQLVCTPTFSCTNPQCGQYKDHICYTCHVKCIDANSCAICMESRECENPEFLNRYYIDPGTKKMIKNKDITLEKVLLHIKYIQESDKILPCCTLCNVAIEKSADCNAISHCGCEICYVCGRREIPEPNKNDQKGLDSNHWVRCPRFFECEQVKQELGYLCRQGKCFHEHDHCAEKNHAKGIQNLEKFRKERHLGAFIESLPARIKGNLKSNL